MRLPSSCLVILVGPSGSGKSTWAASQFPSGQVVSTDDLRELVGDSPHDQRAGRDAFDVLALVLERRLRRGLLTVVDSLGLDDKRRRGWRELARRHGVPCVAVRFDTSPARCRAWNRQRPRPVPAAALSAQLRSFEGIDERLAEDAFDAVHPPEPVEIVPPALLDAPALACRQEEDPMQLRFGLQISRYTWPGGSEELADRLAAIGRAAEEAGFASVWVMDHMVQIPQVGREWEEMLEAYSVLAYLAAVTERCRLGVLVTGITYRNVAMLGKTVATLDVLSKGRAVCGLGAAWFEREHRLYGWEFPAARERLDLLEDALRLLPLLWGPGAPAFEGHALSVPEAVCYPRPLQEHVPILVGGSGERRTLRLVAQYADACNLVGEPDAVRHKLDVLRAHCADVGRDPAEIEITHFSPVLLGTGEGVPAGPARDRALTGPTRDHIGRFRGLAEAGVQTAIVSLADLGDTAPVERFVAVIDAFR